MKNYDNYFLPVDNMEEAKRYYEEILGLKKKFDSLFFMLLNPVHSQKFVVLQLNTLIVSRIA